MADLSHSRACWICGLKPRRLSAREARHYSTGEPIKAYVCEEHAYVDLEDVDQVEAVSRQILDDTVSALFDEQGSDLDSQESIVAEAMLRLQRRGMFSWFDPEDSWTEEDAALERYKLKRRTPST